MKLNPKINFKITVISLIILYVLGHLSYGIHNILIRNISIFCVLIIPLTLFIIGIYGLVKKENKLFSLIAIFFGFSIMINTFITVVNGFS